MSVQVRRFEAATADKHRAANLGRFGRIVTETGGALITLRDRARYAAMNNPWLANAVSNWVASLIGSGVTPSGEEGVTRAFNTWAEDADAEGRTDLYGLQTAIARAMIVDGEAFVQVLPDARLRLIPADLIDDSRSMSLADGVEVVNGVEIGPDGRRLAYWIYPNRALQLGGNPVRVPASEILHIFTPLGAGQVRGISWLAPVLVPAAELDVLQDSLVVGAKTASMLVGFIINQNDMGSVDPFNGEETPSLEPGTLQRLPGGYDVKFSNPTQIANTTPLLNMGFRQIAAGLSLPDFMVSGDLTNANYSSIRAGLIPFRQKIEQIQWHVIIPQFLRPVWRAFVRANPPEGFEDDPARFLSCEWLPPRPIQVDPLKDVQATVAEIEAGLTSRKRAIAERGWTLAEIDSEIEADGFTPRSSLPSGQKEEAENAD